MAGLQSTEDHLRGEIRGHFERAVNYQKMMENAAGLAGDELERIGGLNQELERVRLKAEEVYETLKKEPRGYAGLIATIPAPAVRPENEVDWNEELGKLRKVRDLLATLRQSDPSLAAAPPRSPPPRPRPPRERRDRPRGPRSRRARRLPRPHRHRGRRRPRRPPLRHGAGLGRGGLEAEPEPAALGSSPSRSPSLPPPSVPTSSSPWTPWPAIAGPSR